MYIHSGHSRAITIPQYCTLTSGHIYAFFRNWKFKNKSKTCLIKNESCQVCLIVSVSIRTSWLLLSEVIKELLINGHILIADN
jgi:hypothetical protein